MIKVFDNDIYEISEDHIKIAKQHVIDFLESNNIKLLDQKIMNVVINKTSTKHAKVWHYDDVSIINFIINIQGEGTQILIDDQIKILPKLHGCFVVGEEGYKFFGLKPVLHCAPPVDENRLLLKIIIDGQYNILKYFSGPNVYDRNSEEYKKRSKEIENLPIKI